MPHTRSEFYSPRFPVPDVPVPVGGAAEALSLDLDLRVVADEGGQQRRQPVLGREGPKLAVAEVVTAHANGCTAVSRERRACVANVANVREMC